MLLTLDVGNTNITIGVYHGDRLMFVSRMATDSSRMEDQYAIELRDILDIYDVSIDAIDGAIISSVVPKLTEYLSAAVFKLFGVKPFIVSGKTVDTKAVAEANTENLGPDLIAGYVAACELFTCPCIVIDMGTATTMSVLNREKQLCGLSIIPGIGISLDALVNRAALLTSISLETPKTVIGTDTTECIQSGVMYGAAAMIDGMCERIEKELGYECRVIATGGLAGEVVKNCRREIEFRDTFLLDGLRIIYEKYRKKF